MELKRCANCANGRWTSSEAQVPEICIKCNFNAQGDPSAWEPIVVTNADRIRAMSDEELIAFFVLEDKCPPERYSSKKCDSCKDCWINWLKEPAEVE